MWGPKWEDVAAGRPKGEEVRPPPNTSFALPFDRSVVSIGKGQWSESSTGRPPKLFRSEAAGELGDKDDEQWEGEQERGHDHVPQEAGGAADGAPHPERWQRTFAMVTVHEGSQVQQERGAARRSMRRVPAEQELPGPSAGDARSIPAGHVSHQ